MDILMTLPVPANVFCNAWSYDFYYMTLRHGITASSYDKIKFCHVIPNYNVKNCQKLVLFWLLDLIRHRQVTALNKEYFLNKNLLIPYFSTKYIEIISYKPQQHMFSWSNMNNMFTLLSTASVGAADDHNFSWGIILVPCCGCDVMLKLHACKVRIPSPASLVFQMRL